MTRSKGKDMPIPQVVLETPAYHFNVTVWLSVLTFCLTTMATIVKIFGRHTPEDQKPGKTPYCQKNCTSIKDNKKKIEALGEKNENLKNIANGLEKEVEVLKAETANTNKNLEDIRSSSREVANRLDDLLRQLLEWMND